MIVSYSRTYYLNQFKDWFFYQAKLFPQNRTKDYKLVRNSIDKQITRIRQLKKVLNMPKKKDTPKFVWKGYVNITIPEHMTGDVEKYCSDEKQIFMAMNQAIIDGYQPKLKYSAEKEHFVCNLTAYNTDSANDGYVISAFAGDWFTALAVTLFKHYELTGEDWDDYKSSITKPFG